MALEKLDNVSAAFVNADITVLVSSEDPLEEGDVSAALKDVPKVKISDFQKTEEMPF